MTSSMRSLVLLPALTRQQSWHQMAVRSLFGASSSPLKEAVGLRGFTPLTVSGTSSTRVSRAFNSTEATKNGNSEDKASQEEAKMSELEAKLTEENKELKEKYDDLMDKYRRSIAESDNMRKRLTKQIEDAKVFGIQSFCKDLLEVADVLGKAVEGVSKAEGSDQGSQFLKDMSEGLRLTETQLQQVFKRHGLEVENPLNEKFDPNRHEALFQIPAPDKEPNIVLDVQQVGYLLHGRTIRPALVGVSKK